MKLQRRIQMASRQSPSLPQQRGIFCPKLIWQSGWKYLGYQLGKLLEKLGIKLIRSLYDESGIQDIKTSQAGSKAVPAAAPAVRYYFSYKTEDKDMDENKKDNTNVEETKKDYERYCSLCRRPERVAGQLIEIPGGFHVCPDCMQKKLQAMQG